jgi:hypothetical protein
MYGVGNNGDYIKDLKIKLGPTSIGLLAQQINGIPSLAIHSRHLRSYSRATIILNEHEVTCMGDNGVVVHVIGEDKYASFVGALERLCSTVSEGRATLNDLRKKGNPTLLALED